MNYFCQYPKNATFMSIDQITSKTFLPEVYDTEIQKNQNLSQFQKDQLTYHNPFQAQKYFMNFINSIPNLNKNSSDITYMNLNEKVLIKQVPNIEQFNRIYDQVNKRYKNGYKNNERKLSWSNDDIIVFIWILDKYCSNFQKNPTEFIQNDWIFISKLLSFRTPDDCMFKYLDLRKSSSGKSPWTGAEENYLKLLFQSEKLTWNMISHELYKKYPNVFRSAKQCREHYNLNKTKQYNQSKKLWTSEQDLILIFSYQKQDKKWKNIQNNLIGRSQNAIKNRFSLLVSKYCHDLDKNLETKKLVEIMRERIIQAQKKIMEQKFALIKKLKMMSELQLSISTPKIEDIKEEYQSS